MIRRLMWALPFLLLILGTQDLHGEPELEIEPPPASEPSQYLHKWWHLSPPFPPRYDWPQRSANPPGYGYSFGAISDDRKTWIVSMEYDTGQNQYESAAAFLEIWRSESDDHLPVLTQRFQLGSANDCLCNVLHVGWLEDQWGPLVFVIWHPAEIHWSSDGQMLSILRWDSVASKYAIDTETYFYSSTIWPLRDLPGVSSLVFIAYNNEGTRGTRHVMWPERTDIGPRGMDADRVVFVTPDGGHYRASHSITVGALFDAPRHDQALFSHGFDGAIDGMITYRLYEEPSVISKLIPIADDPVLKEFGPGFYDRPLITEVDTQEPWECLIPKDWERTE